MIELRLDPTTRNWILVGRSETDPGLKEAPRECPFCPGREAATPPTIARIDGPDGRWRVRTFPDKSPVFQIEGDMGREGEGLYDRMRNVGAHEVVVDTPAHGTTAAGLAPADLRAVLSMYRDRIADLKKDDRFRYVLVFKNQGELAGSLIDHAHSHLVATPVVPRRIEHELRWSKQHYELKERCLYCDMVRQELEQQVRIVERNAEFLAFCPFAPRFSYEVWIAPLQHTHVFEVHLGSDAVLDSLAAILKGTLERVERHVRDYHLVLHTAPNEHHPSQWGRPWETLPFDYHWHLEILPRTPGVARLHREEEFYVNPMSPEEAARALRAGA